MEISLARSQQNDPIHPNDFSSSRKPAEQPSMNVNDLFLIRQKDHQFEGEHFINELYQKLKKNTR